MRKPMFLTLIWFFLNSCGAYTGAQAFLAPLVEDILRGAALDPSAPVPGAGGTITAASVTPTSLVLNWTKATDDATASASLQYRVYQSASNDIGSVATAGSTTNMIQNWTGDINTLNVTGLTLNTTYYYNVFVKDDSGNIRAYTMMSQKTLPSMNDYEGFWKFNDLNDSSGHAHTLVNAGAVLTANRSLTSSSAFNMASGSLYVSNMSALNFGNEMSISAWIYITGNPNADQKIVVRLDGSCTDGYAFGVQNAHLYPEVFDSGVGHYTYQDGAFTLSANQWYHVAMTWKTGGQLRTYVNGSLDRSLPAGANPVGTVSGEYFTLGAGTDGVTFPFQGVVDDVRIYGRELSALEVLYLSGLAADCRTQIEIRDGCRIGMRILPRFSAVGI